MLKHGTILSTLEAIGHLLPPREHRTVSLLPPSHLFEQAPVHVLRDDDRRGHPVRPVAQPTRHLRRAARAARDDDGGRPAAARAVLGGPAARDQAPGQGASSSSARPAHRAVAARTGRAGSLFRRIHTPARRRADPVRVGRRLPPARRSRSTGRTSASSSSRATARPSAARRRPRPSRTTRPGRWARRFRRSRCGWTRRRARSWCGAQPSSPGYWKDPDATAAVMSGRVVPHRRRRALRQARQPRPVRAERRTSSCCPTASTSSPRTSRTCSRMWASRRPSCWRRTPGESRPSVLSPDAPPMITAIQPRAGAAPARPRKWPHYAPGSSR